jgi:DNA topoisomerase III
MIMSNETERTLHELNFSADKTLSIAQSLYEKKVMSYPRTGSRYIPEDVFDEMPERVALLGQYSRFAGYAAGLDGTPLNRRSVNDGKVTDHHALIITENLPGELSKDERAVYELVAGRMLEAFSGKCVKDVTTALLSGVHIPADTRSAFPVISVQSPVSIQCCWQS